MYAENEVSVKLQLDKIKDFRFLMSDAYDVPCTAKNLVFLNI